MLVKYNIEYEEWIFSTPFVFSNVLEPVFIRENSLWNILIIKTIIIINWSENRFWHASVVTSFTLFPPHSFASRAIGSPYVYIHYWVVLISNMHRNAHASMMLCVTKGKGVQSWTNRNVSVFLWPHDVAVKECEIASIYRSIVSFQCEWYVHCHVLHLSLCNVSFRKLFAIHRGKCLAYLHVQRFKHANAHSHCLSQWRERDAQ